jgi:uncharacterized protein (TIGR02145 family)
MKVGTVSKNVLVGLGLLLFITIFNPAGIYSQDQKPKDLNYDFKTIIDRRDNQTYKTIKIGDHWWFAENLNYDIEGSYNPEIDSIGRLYNYGSAKLACPEGFHLPSDEEWLELEKFIGIPESQLFDEHGDVNRGNVAHKIKMYKFSLEPENDLLYNITGFSAIPVGYYVRGEHNHLHTTAFWTSTAKDHNSAFVRGLNPHTNGIGRTANSKAFGFSVRCIKDQNK